MNKPNILHKFVKIFIVKSAIFHNNIEKSCIGMTIYLNYILIF